MIVKYIAIAAAGAALTAVSSRADITQTFDFSTNILFSGTSGTTFLPEGYFSASFSPYGGNPADLTSFEIDWSVTLSASATIMPGETGGFAGAPGGAYNVNSTSYNGSGGNLSASTTTPGGTIPLTSITVTNYSVFLPANAGMSYNPVILADMLGTSPVDLEWDTSFNLGYGSILTGEFDETGSVTLIYSAVPEPGTLALAGLGATAWFWRRRRQA